MAAATDSRTDILDAAELLFARQGFDSTTIKAIATTARVNTALLYYYFADKQGLYHAVLERAFGGLIAEGQGRAMSDLDPEDAIRAFVSLQASYFGRHPNRPHLFVRELIDHGAAHAAGQLSRLAATLFRRLCDVIERGQAAGRFRAEAGPAPGRRLHHEPGGLVAGREARHRHPHRRRAGRTLRAVDRGVCRPCRRVRARGAPHRGREAAPAPALPPFEDLEMRLPALLALAALAACRGGAPTAVVATGTLQVDEVDIGPIVPARVVRVFVEEGDSVAPGDTLATLTQATLAPDLAIREARLQAAQAQLTDLERGARPAELRRAEAQLQAASAEAERAAADFHRAEQLASDGTISQQQLDNARAAAATAAGGRDAATATLRLLQEGARSAQIDAARAEVASARGGVAGVQATVEELVLVSSVAGVVAGRHVQPGEVVGAGQAAVTVARAQRPWARIYVGERMLPYLRRGQQVEGVLDGVSPARFAGTVDHINASAEFTPRVALTERERADLVFGVKIVFEPDSTGLLKAGLPITVTIPVAPATTP